MYCYLEDRDMLHYEVRDIKDGSVIESNLKTREEMEAFINALVPVTHKRYDVFGIYADKEKKFFRTLAWKKERDPKTKPEPEPKEEIPWDRLFNYVDMGDGTKEYYDPVKQLTVIKDSLEGKEQLVFRGKLPPPEELKKMKQLIVFLSKGGKFGF